MELYQIQCEFQNRHQGNYVHLYTSIVKAILDFFFFFAITNLQLREEHHAYQAAPPHQQS